MIEFEIVGYKCKIIQAMTGHLCGYVGVSKTHQFYGQDYSDNDYRIDNLMEVHGGVTFTGKHGKDDELWYIGFDCAHWGDAPSKEKEDMWNTYKDVDFVKAEIEKMVKQLKKYEGQKND